MNKFTNFQNSHINSDYKCPQPKISSLDKLFQKDEIKIYASTLAKKNVERRFQQSK
ncbi:hypothetical protein [Acinetobacter baumannii]|uniref:hypothetical protein n=1 Tax=Acinetobacter baumannii TaxID=470 RepID=UPI0021BED735|nr:hypothetical protein [Acinetobacter baumannii]MCT9178091.1 hypothetical protein [Acinetobacter baumannii]MDA5807182.1 hypothetical protein [Acinetobacter baumannii]